MKRWMILCRSLILAFTAMGCAQESSVIAQTAQSAEPVTLTEQWASSENLNITLNAVGTSPIVLTKSGNDFKPSWSPDGTMLTFFRAYRYGSDFKDWRTKVCVINADGSGFRELTSGQYPDFNPTWTRDGSNRIIFNRYSQYGGWHNQVYWIEPTGTSGDEQLLSDPDYQDYEWVTGALKDGRLFIDRISNDTVQSFLLTPRPGQKGIYEEIKRPNNLLWHKLHIAPSETKVTYMLDHDRNTGTYQDVEICYADFDVKTRRIFNQVTVAQQDRRFIREYPCWTKDERLILYDANQSGKYQIYGYCLADRTTQRISPREDRNYMFADVEGLPK